MGQYGIPHIFIRTFQALYHQSSRCVTEGGRYSNWFKVKSGLQQGCVLSGFIFVLIMDWVMWHTNDTVLVKCKLTVSTQNLILDPWCFREWRIKFRGSSFEFWVSSIEFWDAQRIFQESDLYLEFVTIEINNTTRRAASFIRARVHVFHINVQIVSLELKSWITII